LIYETQEDCLHITWLYAGGYHGCWSIKAYCSGWSGWFL